MRFKKEVPSIFSLLSDEQVFALVKKDFFYFYCDDLLSFYLLICCVTLIDFRY